MKSLVLLLCVLFIVEAVEEGRADWNDVYCKQGKGLPSRPHSVSIREFGAVGDGKTLNTIAFDNAIFYLKSLADKGGAQLYVPKGRWLTGSFKITSHLTIFLGEDAVIIGTEELSHWPVEEPLPSYGNGKAQSGGRYRSLISGQNLTDVIITGYNGTIDGQGSIWWQQFHSPSLNYTRPHLVELVNCDDIVISNLTFVNSPSSSIHPVYCSNLQIQKITIVAPSDSPYTEGIIPDSCSIVCIEDCNVSVSHDAIVLKSGWDEYGISYARPVSNVYINRANLQSSLGSALAFGSEMSGGISDIYIESLRIFNSSTGIKFKTTRGRGGSIKRILISDVEMADVYTAIQFTGNCGQHPDDHFDPDALPVINKITLMNMVGKGISIAGNFSGIIDGPFTDICLSYINFSVTSEPSTRWTCSYVSGFSESVIPQPCANLSMPYSQTQCYSPQTIGLNVA